MIRTLGITALIAASALAACSGGGGGGGGYVAPTAHPTATSTSTASTQQVVSLSIPGSAIGSEDDPTFGNVAGYTQTVYSQVLGFVPGQQIMIHNGQSNIPHTLGDLGTQNFPASQPGSLSTTGTGSSTLSAGWQSGTISPNGSVGPITLTAGTFYIGCAYHYQSNGMRDVLVVASNATPGPAATQVPGDATPTPSSGGGYGY